MVFFEFLLDFGFSVVLWFSLSFCLFFCGFAGLSVVFFWLPLSFCCFFCGFAGFSVASMVFFEFLLDFLWFC